MYNTAPRYKKIEIILNKTTTEKNGWYGDVVKNKKENEEEDSKVKKVNDPFFSNREKCIFEDAALVITGGYILITQDFGNDEVGGEKSTTGRIFDLKDVYSYKAYFEQR